MTVRSAWRTPVSPEEGWAGRSRRLTRRALGRDWRVAYLFVAPLLALLFGLIGYPLVKALHLSLYATIGRSSPRFVGLENYILVWQNASYRDMLAITANSTCAVQMLLVARSRRMCCSRVCNASR